MAGPTGPGGPNRRGLTRERVLDAAITLADTHGIDGLTMRRLGEALGVQAMALYNHVEHKDDLLDAMVDRVAESIVLPPDVPAAQAAGHWAEHARRRALAAHAVLIGHPWVAPLWASRLALGPARMRSMDAALANLRRAGFPPGLLDQAYHTIENHILGHAMQAQAFPLEPEQMQEVGEAFLRTFPSAEYPELAAHIRHHLEPTTDAGEGDDGFAFGLELILDGLERLRSAPARRSGGPVR